MAVGAAGLGILGLVQNYMEQKDTDRQAAKEAESFGIRSAGIDFSAERKSEFIIKQVGLIQEAELQGNIAVDKNQAQAESDAKVSAAGAGVSGQSIDAVVNETERSAGETKSSLQKQVRQQKLQLSTDYVDNFINATIEKGKVNYDQASSGERAAGGILGFAKGFIMGL